MNRVLTLILFFSFSGVFAQESNLKEIALNEFKKEHYDKAISLLEQALLTIPDDAEIYYYLGFFNHYRAYDSRPLEGYDLSYSKRIFEYLKKAIDLNPNYGDAKYFYGAECSANAFVSMQNYDLKQLQYFYKLAYDMGAYPEWLLEFGRNMLSSCDKDAILFTGGNADFDICSYLQLHENFRKDITIIPIGNIDRPWYVKCLKEGLEGGVRKITMNLSDQQIFDIHPFKWDTTTVAIPIPLKMRDKYKLEANYRMQWTVEPDLSSVRNHSKIAGEKPKKRTFLSPRRAVLLQIIEDNFPSRPIFFSRGTHPFFYAGLDAFFQNCGLVFKLLPIQTGNTKYENNFTKFEQLLQNENLKDYSTIKKNNIPRVSGMVFDYHGALLHLANYYKNQNRTEELVKIGALLEERLLIGFKPGREKRYIEIFEKITAGNI